MKKVIIGIVCALVSAGVVSAASGTKWQAYDTAPAVAVKYVGTSGTGAVTVAASTVTLTAAGDAADVATTITLTPTYTVASLVAAINAATNTAGTYVWQAQEWASLAADTVSNLLITGTTVLVPKEWSVSALKWDTSGVLRYDVVPDGPVGSGRHGQLRH